MPHRFGTTFQNIRSSCRSTRRPMQRAELRGKCVRLLRPDLYHQSPALTCSYCLAGSGPCLVRGALAALECLGSVSSGGADLGVPRSPFNTPRACWACLMATSNVCVGQQRNGNTV